MNNSTVRKNLALFLILSLGLASSSIAFASSYTISFAFSHELKSTTRYFDGQNISFEGTPHTYPDPKYPDAQPVDSIYRATLIRDNGWFQSNDTIGTATLSRDSWGRAIWTNVGPGNYYILFQKEKDRIIVDENDAKMYNY